MMRKLRHENTVSGDDVTRLRGNYLLYQNTQYYSMQDLTQHCKREIRIYNHILIDSWSKLFVLKLYKVLSSIRYPKTCYGVDYSFS